MRTIIDVLLAAVALWGQDVQAPAWKQFSIGPPTRDHARFGPDGVQAEGVTLKKVLARLYGLPENRIAGPDWIGADRYAITALVANPADFQPLMQRELKARFHMVARREKKEVPVYVLKPFAGADTKPPAKGAPVISMPNTTVAAFANALGDFIHRPVFDETGITGSFDITLNWQVGNTASLLAAVKDQLDLQLVESRRALDILTIDHIEKPQFSK